MSGVRSISRDLAQYLQPHKCFVSLQTDATPLSPTISTQIMMFNAALPRNIQWIKLFILLLSCQGAIVNAQCDRQAMVDDYLQNHEGTNIFTTEDLGWTGDSDSCLAGQISASALAKTLQRINYYRRLAKLSTEVTFDTSLTAMCQEAALMMHSNNALMHDPPSSWMCYSEDGKTAASRSNLALGAHTTRAIALYMIDPGTGNYAVGHRRWILYSRAKEFGMGSTNRAHSLYVVNNKIPAPEDYEYTAYPSEGFFPAPIVPDRWSLSVGGANFEDVKITMQNEEGESIPVALQEIKNGFGDNTIVWEPEASMIEKFSDFDRTYNIQVENIIVAGEPRDIAYQVTIANIVHPPLCADGTSWSESLCGCSKDQTTPVNNLLEEPEVILFPNPTSEFVNLKFPSDWTFVEIQVSNLMGSVQIEQKATQGAVAIPVQELSAGVYCIRIQHQDEVYTKKLTIQH